MLQMLCSQMAFSKKRTFSTASTMEFNGVGGNDEIHSITRLKRLYMYMHM